MVCPFSRAVLIIMFFKFYLILFISMEKDKWKIQLWGSASTTPYLVWSPVSAEAHLPSAAFSLLVNRPSLELLIPTLCLITIGGDEKICQQLKNEASNVKAITGLHDTLLQLFFPGCIEIAHVQLEPFPFSMFVVLSSIFVEGAKSHLSLSFAHDVYGQKNHYCALTSGESRVVWIHTQLLPSFIYMCV